MNVLVIGGGSMGRRRLRDLSYLCAGGVLLFEPSEERCAEVSKSFGVAGFTDLQTALGHQPDALVVSTPPAFHEPYVRLAIERGLHVFSEVPFLLEYGVLKEIAEQSPTKKLVMGVSHTIRYYPPYRLIHDLINENAIGKALYVEYSLGNYLPDWHPYEDYRKFYANDQKLGGAGMDMLLHEISAIQWWLGNISHVQARLSKVSTLEIAGPDTHDVLMRFASGTVGFFHHDVIERGTIGRHVRIVGEYGTIEWHQNQPAVRVYHGKEAREEILGYEKAADWGSAMEASRRAAELVAQKRAGSGVIPTASAPSFTYESCYLREISHFLSAARGEAAYAGCTLVDELNNVAAFESILESAETGRELAVQSRLNV